MDANNGDFFIKMQSVYPAMRKSEKLVADYIKTNGAKAVLMTSTELAKASNVSFATVMRFCHAMEYDGFPSMKLGLARGLAIEDSMKNEHPQFGISPETKLANLPERIIARSIKALDATLKILSNTEFEKAVEILIQSTDIFLFGVANSISVADDAMNKFIRLGKRCHVIGDAHLQVMTATNLKRSDVVIGISHSGKTKETIDTLRLAKKSGAKIISITNSAASMITEISDVSLLTADFETGFFSETMASRICQLAIIDMLYIGVMLSDYESNANRLNMLNENLSKHSY